MKKSPIGSRSPICLGILGLAVSAFGGLAEGQALTPAPNAIDSDYVLSVSSSTYGATVSQSLKTFLTGSSFSVAEYEVSQSPTLHLSQISVEFSSADAQVQASGDTISFSAQKNTVQVHLGQVLVDETITQTVNGIIVSIPIHASCSGFSLTLNDPNSNISATLSPEINGDFLGFMVTNPVLQLGAPVLEGSAVQCSGPAGFEQLITTTLQKELANTAGLNAYIEQQILANLNTQVANYAYNWKAPQMLLQTTIVFGNQQGPLQLWINPEQFTPQADGSWLSQGTMRLLLPWNLLTAVPMLHFTDASKAVAAAQGSPTGVLVFPEQMIPEMVSAYLTPNEWTLTGSANAISGFQDLLNCWLLELFVWPDLQRFKKSTPFVYNAFVPAPVTTTWGQNLNLNFTSPLLVDLTEESKPYLHLSAQIKSVLSPSVVNGQLLFSSSSNNMRVNYKWDPAACGKDGCGFIATFLVIPFVESFLNGQKFQFPLPTVPLAPGVVLKANSVLRDSTNQLVSLTFGP